MLEKKVNGNAFATVSLPGTWDQCSATPRSRLRWVKSLFAALTRLRSALEEELQKRRAIAELANMDDRMPPRYRNWSKRNRERRARIAGAPPSDGIQVSPDGAVKDDRRVRGGSVGAAARPDHERNSRIFTTSVSSR